MTNPANLTDDELRAAAVAALNTSPALRTVTRLRRTLALMHEMDVRGL